MELAAHIARPARTTSLGQSTILLQKGSACVQSPRFGRSRIKERDRDELFVVPFDTKTGWTANEDREHRGQSSNQRYRLLTSSPRFFSHFSQWAGQLEHGSSVGRKPNP